MTWLSVALLFLLAHWIGDFVLQTDYQATHKHRQNMALFLHVCTLTGTYLVAFTLAGMILHYSLETTLVLTLVNGGVHYFIDYLTSRLNEVLWRDQERHMFFTSIGFDQFLHYTVLAVSLYLVYP